MLTRTSTAFNLLVTCVFSIASYGKITTLEEARKDLKLPEYSASERSLIAKQAEFFISNLYVHRDLKVKDFGASVDPVPRLLNLKDNAADLTNEEFHNRMTQIFYDLHDLHTNYHAPAPLACGAAFVPLRFQGVLDGDRSVVVVSRKLKVQEDLVKDISVGDELVSVDGEATGKLVERLKKVSGGANPDAMYSRAIQLISMKNGSSQALPEKNNIVLKLKNDSGEYEKELPWSAFIDEDCVSNVNSNSFRFRRDMMRLGVDEYQRRFNKIFSPSHPENAEWTWFGEEALKEVYETALINTPAGPIGYVQLKAFYWDNRNLDIQTVIDSLRNEIESNLSTAVGLVIDVRGNPGGYIVLSEKLIQLFSTRIVAPTTVQMLANDLNESIFLKANGAENRWTESIRGAIKNKQRYTSPMAITPISEANSFGQVWYRPVVVLTDASCYSACDLFSAGMQDAKAGVIIGLHQRTGAGGANVMEYNTFRRIMGSENNPFEVLPFGQNMRVSWRQTIRSGLHNGELLEDAGVASDIVIPLKKKDITHGESKELMAQIHKNIDLLAPKYISGLGIRRGSSVLFENAKPARWKEKIYGVDQIQFQAGEKVLGVQDIKLSDAPEEVELFAPSMTGEWTDARVVLVGKLKGQQVLRVVRELIWRGEYYSIPAEGLNINFDPEGKDRTDASKAQPNRNEDNSILTVLKNVFWPTTPKPAGGENNTNALNTRGSSPSFKTVLLRGNAGSGWQVVDGKFRVGKGPKYDANVLARANLSVKLNGSGATMVLDLSLEAEDENDSLRIYAVNPDTGERKHLFAGSEIRPVKGAKIPLPMDWDRADIVFEFESDENWNMTGPIVDNVKIIQ